MKRKRLLLTSVIGIVLIIGITYLICINVQVSKYKNKIYKGITIEGVDVSGMTQKEAIKALNKELHLDEAKKPLKIAVGDKVNTYDYNDIELSCDLNKAVNKAIRYGKEKNIFKRSSMISKGCKKEIDVSITYNGAKLKELEAKIMEDVNIEATNAKITINNGNITITPEQVGYKISEKKLHDELITKLTKHMNSSVMKISLKKTNPTVKEADLKKIKSTPMSTYTTYYGASTADRAENVQIAASLVNGTVLMPNEEFSYSEVSQRGRGQYKDAAVYVNNKVEQAEAGGICQVSSTLYNAVMRANIRSTQRTNHSLPVSYVPKGLDATVSWGYLDYKFKNPYDFPVYLEAIASGGVLTINVYGDISVLKGITYDLTSNVVETIQPETVYEDDANLDEGVEEVEQGGQVGYKVESYIIGYKDGKEVSKELIANDTYAVTNQIVKRGTKKPEVTTTEEQAVPEDNTSEKTEENNDSNEQKPQEESDNEQ